MGKRILTNCVYLEESAVYIKGIKFYGCPFSRKGNSTNDAFQMSTEELKSKWEKIPFDTDILITHMPPYGINDMVKHSPDPQGCKHLLYEVTERIKPKLHLYGHIHIGGSQKLGKRCLLMLLSAVLLTINPLLLTTNSSIDDIDENMDSQIKYHTVMETILFFK